MTCNFFRRFYRWNDRGIQTRISIQWRDPFTVRITDGYTDRTCPSKIPSVKANISTICRLSPPLFLLLLPHPNSPLSNCKQPPTPLKVSPSSQHKHPSFLYFCTWSQHPFFDLLWILSFFVSKSIIFYFNIKMSIYYYYMYFVNVCTCFIVICQRNL